MAVEDEKEAAEARRRESSEAEKERAEKKSAI